jgi:hypothetical protein
MIGREVDCKHLLHRGPAHHQGTSKPSTHDVLALKKTFVVQIRDNELYLYDIHTVPSYTGHRLTGLTVSLPEVKILEVERNYSL